MERRVPPLWIWLLTLVVAVVLTAGFAAYSKLVHGDIWYFLAKTETFTSIHDIYFS